MRRHFELSPEGSPTVVFAFQGWNDVSGAALEALDHLGRVTKARLWADVDPEEYYDFQVNQPRIDVVAGERVVVWRTTEIHHAVVPGVGDMLFVKGIEPSFRWKAFLAELLETLQAVGPARYVILGGVPGETPHTRPLPVTTTSPQEAARSRYGASAPSYVGPTGMLGVLIDALGRSPVETVAQWVVMPQYAIGGPQPKVALALVTALGTLLEVPLPLADLEETARAWERGVDEAVSEDGDMVSYVDTLEHAIDVTDLPEAQGEAIAEEFAQFLRRRDDRQGREERGDAGGSTGDGTL